MKTKKLDASALSKIRNVDSPEEQKNKLRFTAKSDKGAYVKSGAGRKGGETVPATLPPGRMPRVVHVHVRVLDYDQDYDQDEDFESTKFATKLGDNAIIEKITRKTRKHLFLVGGRDLQLRRPRRRTQRGEFTNPRHSRN